ncbi:MAG TPA: peptidoglycan DD-metalloendopeptidase family protein [Gemmatimonadaceae bacterium]|nr:peptidoglycan DD-metalloendopeptidase family protein [Gemmatimonadaceae bacterium]
MRELQGSVRDLTAEVRNLDRQADATARLVRSLGTQLEAIDGEVRSTSTDLVRAQDELVAARATLRRRVRDIYKRGPLFDVQALLSAGSFAELLARYKYLHQLALHDKRLMTQVQVLRDRVGSKREYLVRLQEQLTFNRAEKAMEEERLRALEQQRQRALVQTRRDARRTESRLADIARDERRLAGVIASLEAARRRAESRPNAASPRTSTLRTADVGRLDWPVDGDIIYRFGRVVNPNNTTTRWNGIGIAAAAGTSVRALAAGEVVVAQHMGTYGLTVIVQHGGGDYSVYGSLQRANVAVGTTVRKGQIIGTVGSADPELGPHLHLEIRRDRGRAVDPLEWLRGNR